MVAPRRRTRRAGRTRRRNAAAPRVENAEFARMFNEMADLLELEDANAFRVRAYRNAARVLEEHPESVAELARRDPATLTELPGIGDDLAGKIVEIASSGRLVALRQARAAAPAGAVALMQLPGLGPRRAKQLAERLNVRSLGDLHRAIQHHRVRELPGFGEKTEARLRDALESHAMHAGRVLRATAAQYGEALLEWMRSLRGVRVAELAGSYRRCRETVGDLDLLVCAAPGTPAVERFCDYPEVERVLARGSTRVTVTLRSGLQVDLRVLPPESCGAGLYYFTGSKAHNIAVRARGRSRGLKINEYGVFRGQRRVGGRDEKEVFAAVGLPWIPPELRENRGEIEAAARGALPRLIQPDDLRGDLQTHTTDSDGRESLETMALAGEALGHEYLAITDHTRLVRIVGGMDRAGFRRQRRKIDRLNARLRHLTLLAGAEVDILEDGRLDLDDETLASLDIVLVALHSKLDLPPAAQTKRVLRALQHPAVDVFAHPTGRLIAGRRGARFDFDAVCRAAADHGVMLEINAQPSRLDLDDTAARAAREFGVRFTISTDAHSPAELRFLRWGVDQARRGWIEKRDVANTRPLASLRKLLHGAR